MFVWVALQYLNCSVISGLPCNMFEMTASMSQQLQLRYHACGLSISENTIVVFPSCVSSSARMVPTK